ncbi:MAG: thioredoxin domain-containing protein [Polyangia bacterium]
MRSSKLMIVVVVAALCVSTAPVLEASDVAWDEVIGADASKLNAEQKSRVASLLDELDNTRGCSGKIGECLAKGDRTAARHAGFVMRMVRKNKSDDFIEKGIELRHESAFPDETYDIDLSGHPHRGNPNAKVEFVEYACFQCPFCADLAPKMKRQFKKRFADDVVHYYKFFPVRSHSHGVSTALAGLAAFKQGKFWELYDIMFDNRTDLADDDVRRYARQVGLDMEKFESDWHDSGAMQVIEQDKLEGMRFGVRGTPTFFVNGKLYQGQNYIPEVLDRVGEELDIVEGRIK